MTIKQFKEKEIPKFKFNIKAPGQVLVQVYFTKPDSKTIILAEDTKNKHTEIRNVFRVLIDSDNYKAGAIVSLSDSLVEPPIVEYRPAVGNDPSAPARPVYGVAMANLQPYTFDCNKTMEDDYKTSLVFLIPEQFITIEHTI